MDQENVNIFISDAQNPNLYYLLSLLLDSETKLFRNKNFSLRLHNPTPSEPSIDEKVNLDEFVEQIQESAFSKLIEIKYGGCGSDLQQLFKDVHLVLLLDSIPYKILREYSENINNHSNHKCKIVVGNDPVELTCMILSRYIPKLPLENILGHIDLHKHLWKPLGGSMREAYSIYKSLFKIYESTQLPLSPYEYLISTVTSYPQFELFFKFPIPDEQMNLPSNLENMHKVRKKDEDMKKNNNNNNNNKEECEEKLKFRGEKLGRRVFSSLDHNKAKLCKL